MLFDQAADAEGQHREGQHRGGLDGHSMDLSSLPVEVIAAILSHVSLKERLSTCALVCRTWAAASAGASKVLTVQLRSQAQADNLAAWLAQYGSSIEQLSVATDHMAYEESVLQWRRQRMRRGDDGVDVVVSQVEGSLVAQMLADYKDEPIPQCFIATIPLSRLLSLRRLSLENVRVHCSSWPHKQPTPAATAEPTAQTPTAANGCITNSNSAHASTAGVDADAVDAAGSCSSEGTVHIDPSWLSHLTHLHTDSSFISLLRVFGGNLRPFRNLQALRITLGPRDSEFLGSYWAKHGNEAFQALSAQCVQLQRLLLGTSNVTSDGLKQMHCMRQLRHVELHVPGGSFRRPAGLATWLEHLPEQQLTQLVLKPLACRNADKSLDLSAASIGQLSRFTRLQHLDLSYGTNFATSVLASLTALTHLQLSEVDMPKPPLADLGTTGIQQQQQQQGSAAMLAVLPCLQELRVLQLSPGLLPAPHAPLDQYSALTASSYLMLLSLYHCQLPAGAASAMFPPGRSLPDLTSIRMPQPPAGHRPCATDTLATRSPFLSSGAAAALRAACATTTTATTSSSSDVDAAGVPFGPGSIASLASCCPNLGQLWLTAAVAAGADLMPLRQLGVLTELQLGGGVVDDGVSERVLSGLSQLQRLDLVQCPRFTDAGLVYLTALTGLTSLQVRDCGLSHCTAGLGHVLYMCKRQEGVYSGTPVCDRLRQQCSNSRDCLLVMLQQRDKQLAAASAALAAAEARAAAAEARLAGMGVLQQQEQQQQRQQQH